MYLCQIGGIDIHEEFHFDSADWDDDCVGLCNCASNQQWRIQSFEATSTRSLLLQHYVPDPLRDGKI